jgi:Taurine catabolism dioxygenase TauD, TfdA family
MMLINGFIIHYWREKSSSAVDILSRVASNQRPSDSSLPGSHDAPGLTIARRWSLIVHAGQVFEIGGIALLRDLSGRTPPPPRSFGRRQHPAEPGMTPIVPGTPYSRTRHGGLVLRRPTSTPSALHRAGAKQYAPGSQLADAVKDLPDVIHPVIRTHPVTGRRAIYVRAGECVGIVGMPDAEALPRIQELSDFVTRPEFLYRHRWRVGDLLMWW